MEYRKIKNDIFIIRIFPRSRIAKIHISCSFAILFSFICLTAYMMRPFDEAQYGFGTDKDFYIAHAGGAIDGICYTNSEEALLSSIKKGYKYIELDLFLTNDSNVICLHDIKDFNTMTGEDYTSLTTDQFKSCKFYEKYTPITLNEAVKIWEENSFVFVTDKISDPYILNQYFKHKRNRVFVEVFNIEEYRKLQEAGYTPMYGTYKGLKGAIQFVLTRLRYGKIEWITASTKTEDIYLRLYKRLGSRIAVYTVNNYNYYLHHLKKDVDLFYTDSMK